MRFNFKQYGELEIHHVEACDFSEREQLLIEVKPTPELKLSKQSDPIVSSENGVSFFSLESIQKVSWQKKIYSTDDFIKEQVERSSNRRKIKYIKGILKAGDKMFITSGLRLNELNSITFNYLHIEHLISYRQIKKRSENFDIFLMKFRELAMSRCCQLFGERMRGDTTAIKSFTPITVSSDFPVVSDIFYQILMADGYQQVFTTEQVIEHSDHLQLNLTDSSESHNSSVFSRDLLLETNIFDIPGFPKVNRTISSQPPDVNETSSVEDFRLERAQLLKKLKKLGDQLKSLSGSKILADQEKYMNMLASRKLEIVMVLLEMAAFWDEKDEKQKRTYEENVLIFHDDEIQASTINNKLEGDGKRLFVDVTKKFSNLKTFVTLNTDILEPFLHEGFIFCYAASKPNAVKKMLQFQEELSEKKYPDLVKGMENLKIEKSKLQNQLIKLAYAEAWFILKGSYQDQADLIFNAAKNAYQAMKQRRFSQDIVRSLCVFSSDAKRCHQVQYALTRTFANLVESRFERILLPLNLSNRISDDEISGFKELSKNEDIEEALIQEALTQRNLKHLSSYLKRALKELNLITTDLLVIVQNLDLIAILVRMLRESNKNAMHTPILAVFSGAFNIEKMIELEKQGVILVYYDPFFSEKEDNLTDQFRMLFS